MTSSLLDISQCANELNIDIFSMVHQAAKELSISYLIIGACARDLILHLGYQQPIQRRTADIDFAIKVKNWEEYQNLKTNLESKGFESRGENHRLYYMKNFWIDIVPFGEIETNPHQIAWPPSKDTIMNVMGFEEAILYAQIVRLKHSPPLDVPVACVESIAFLKILSWLDRNITDRKKDAKDFLYCIHSYGNIPQIENILYEKTELMEKYSWDLECAASHLLGSNCSLMTQKSTASSILSFFENDQKVTAFTENMCETIERQFERNTQLLLAFVNGFQPSN
jgi:predicted nucleotidyltransferase